jgi:hypothetical protein
LAFVVSLQDVLHACPFCATVSKTFSEEIDTIDAAVLARLDLIEAKVPENQVADPNAEPINYGTFTITHVLKGEAVLGELKRMNIPYFSQDPVGSTFYVTGTDPPEFNWGTPLPASPRLVSYLMELPKLPKEGPNRLAFFQEYFEDPEPAMANDAYDEFARSSYTAIRALKDRMQREKLIAWLGNPDLAVSRKRLYLTLLGVCGRPEDVPLVEALVKSTVRDTKTALDAAIGSYLVLKGPDALPLVEDLFLKNKQAEYTDTYACIQAIRVVGEESDVIPRPRLAEALRCMLDRPDLADLVIADLARWEDWSAAERIATLFREATDATSFIQIPAIQYMMACPLPEAKTYLEEMARLDPEKVKRAKLSLPFSLRPQVAGASAQPSGDASAAAPPVSSPTDAPPPSPAEGQSAPPIDSASGSETPAEPAGEPGDIPSTPAPAPADAVASSQPPPNSPPLAIAPENGSTGWPPYLVVAIPLMIGVGLYAAMYFVLRGIKRRPAG